MTSFLRFPYQKKKTSLNERSIHNWPGQHFKAVKFCKPVLLVCLSCTSAAASFLVEFNLTNNVRFIAERLYFNQFEFTGYYLEKRYLLS